MKKISVIILLFLLLGCSIQNDGWTISTKEIKSVVLTDSLSNSVILNKEDSLSIIESFNAIKERPLNQYFNDGDAVFGHDNYSLIVKTKDEKIRIGFIDYGLLNIYDYDDESTIYYDIDIFSDFFDKTRMMADKYGLDVIDMTGYCNNDEYLKLLFTTKEEYLVGGQLTVNEFVNEIDLNMKLDEDMSFSDFLLTKNNHAQVNDVIEFEQFTVKIIGTDGEQINTFFLRVNRNLIVD